MTSEQVQVCDALWSEALAAGLVRYRRGMVTHSGLIIASADLLRVYTAAGTVRVSPADVRLDWSHPATGGCLLALAREVTGDPWLHAVLSGPFMDGRDWTARGRGPSPAGGIYAHTEPEALLRAILATRGER